MTTSVADSPSTPPTSQMVLTFFFSLIYHVISSLKVFLSMDNSRFLGVVPFIVIISLKVL